MVMGEGWGGADGKQEGLLSQLHLPVRHVVPTDGRTGLCEPVQTIYLLIKIIYYVFVVIIMGVIWLPPFCF
jgi:hypothetical protein